MQPALPPRHHDTRCAAPDPCARCSSHQIAAAWAWLEHSAARPSEAPTDRADVVSSAARRRTTTTPRPSRFQQELLAPSNLLDRSADPVPSASAAALLHRSSSGKDCESADNWKPGGITVRNGSDRLGSLPALDHGQRHSTHGVDRHGYRISLSSLLDDFEVESLCKHLRHHIIGDDASPALQIKNTCFRKENVETEVIKKEAKSDERSPDEDHHPGDNRPAPGNKHCRSPSMQKSHSMSDFLSRVLHDQVGGENLRIRRRLPLICSSMATINSVSSDNQIGNVVLRPIAGRGNTKAKHRNALQHYPGTIAKIGVGKSVHSQYSGELDCQNRHRLVHHHHHHHHHHHVLQEPAGGASLRFEYVMPGDTMREGRSAFLLSSKQQEREDNSISEKSRDLLVGSHCLRVQRTEKLPNDSKYADPEGTITEPVNAYRGLPSIKKVFPPSHNGPTSLKA